MINGIIPWGIDKSLITWGARGTHTCTDLSWLVNAEGNLPLITQKWSDFGR